MNKIKHSDQSHDLILHKSEIETAMRDFIIINYPEYKGWILNSTYNIADVLFSATKSMNENA